MEKRLGAEATEGEDEADLGAADVVVVVVAGEEEEEEAGEVVAEAPVVVEDAVFEAEVPLLVAMVRNLTALAATEVGLMTLDELFVAADLVAEVVVEETVLVAYPNDPKLDPGTKRPKAEMLVIRLRDPENMVTMNWQRMVEK